jgi:hypothetical protein
MMTGFARVGQTGGRSQFRERKGASGGQGRGPCTRLFSGSPIAERRRHAANASIHRLVGARVAVIGPSPTMDAGLRQHDK